MKEIKKIAIGALIFLSWSLFVYGMFAFSLGATDGLMWGESSRILYCYCGPFMGLLVTLAIIFLHLND